MTSRIETGTDIINVDQDDQLIVSLVPQKRRHRFDKSYGAMTMIMEYLSRLEQLKLQGLDTWWYDKGVKRVQWRFIFPKMFFFADY